MSDSVPSERDGRYAAAYHFAVKKKTDITVREQREFAEAYADFYALQDITVNDAWNYYQAKLAEWEFEVVHCVAKDLLKHKPAWLRVEGDSDDPNTWHEVEVVKDHFGDIEALTVTFKDGTGEKLLNETDAVEIAVLSPR